MTAHKPCSGPSPRWTRRRVLEAGALGALGIGLPGLWQRRAKAGPAPAARAKRAILLFMWGGPSQLDTFDMKPEAPAEIRGPFQPIATCTPGLQICEHFQRLAAHSDKLAVIRSLTHDDPAHLSSVHTLLTGHLPPVNKSDAEPPSDRDTPHLGAVLARLRPPQGALPSAVTLPWIVSHPAAPGGQAPGQHGGWLGRGADPLLITGDPNEPGWQVPALALRDDIPMARLNARRDLLASIDRQRATLAEAAACETTDQLSARAFDLLTSPEVRGAFDLDAEPAGVRDRYGRHIHGQCVLLARRLAERDVPLVTVNWHNDGHNFWDTHGENFTRLKSELIPPADQALAALLEDLADRGLLDDTIVAWIGEFGRRPQISAGGNGREHWPYCYSGLLAGAGIRGGAIYGASDKHAARPADSPVRPQDVTATLYHALGVDPELRLPDASGRPLPFCEGRPLRELF